MPFLVRKHFTKVPVITTKGILDQYIFTYCFISNETSEKLTVADILHSFRGHGILSEVTISNISERLPSIAFHLDTLGYQEVNTKEISIHKWESRVANIALGWSVNMTFGPFKPVRYDIRKTPNGDIEVRSPYMYNRRVQRAQYSCLKSDLLPVRSFNITICWTMSGLKQSGTQRRWPYT